MDQLRQFIVFPFSQNTSVDLNRNIIGDVTGDLIDNVITPKNTEMFFLFVSVKKKN